MNTDQADAIENLMAQGFTRVQAIKIFYEQSLAKFYTKQYHNDDTDLFDQTGLVRTNVEKFHALEQSHLVEKPINILGRRFSKPDAEHHPNYEHPHQLHHPSHHGMRHHDAADGERSPSELSLDSCFKALPPSAETSNEVITLDAPQPPLGSNSQQYKSRSEERNQGLKETVALFPSVEFENEVSYEEDESLCGADPTISNVARFLSSCDFSTEEKQEFFYLLSQGLNIDEASDRIYQKRLNGFMNQLPPSNRQMTKELFSQTVHDHERSVRPRYPLRLHGFTGNREEDVRMLIDRGYSKDVANFICDFMYQVGEEFFRKHFGLDFLLHPPSQRLSGIPEEVVEPASTAHPRSTTNGTTEPHLASVILGTNAKVGVDGSGDGEEDLFIENGEDINADTIVQLKRLRTFARGGFKSNFSIENNCAVSELEALKLGLIISQQEADYGINMYDALLPSDEQQIEKLIRTGLTLDEAILKVFESRFGKTKLDSSALQMLEEMTGKSSGSNGSFDVLRGTANKSSEAEGVDYQVADKLESEISLLMLSGYTREEAVKILLERKKKEQPSDTGSMTSASSKDGNMSYPSLNNPTPTTNTASPQKRLTRELSQERIEREIMMNQLPPSAQRKAQQQQQQPSPSPATIPKSTSARSEDRTDAGIIPTAALPIEATVHTPTNGNLPRFNSEYEAMIHHQLSIDPYHSTGNSRVGNAYPSHMNMPYVDTRRMPPPSYDGYSNRSPMMDPAAMHTPPHHNSHQMYSPNPPLPPAPHPTPMQAPTYRHEEYRILRDISGDEKAFRIGILISQQEAAFGTNMYQSIHTGDAGEMTQLIARGYNEDEAALLLFERKYGRTPPLPETMYQPSPAQAMHYQTPPPNNRGGNMDQTPGAVRVGGTPYSGNSSRVPSSNSLSTAGGNSVSSYRQQQHPHSGSPVIRVNNAYPAPTNSPNRGNYSNHHSPAAAASRRPMNQPPQQYAQYPMAGQPVMRSNSSSANSPQVRRIPSMHQQMTQSPMGSNDMGDIHPNDLQVLIGMGFSQAQAVQALRMKNYNVQAAAEYLLEQ